MEMDYALDSIKPHTHTYTHTNTHTHRKQIQFTLLTISGVWTARSASLLRGGMHRIERNHILAHFSRVPNHVAGTRWRLGTRKGSPRETFYTGCERDPQIVSLKGRDLHGLPPAGRPAEPTSQCSTNTIPIDFQKKRAKLCNSIGTNICCLAWS